SQRARPCSLAGRISRFASNTKARSVKLGPFLARGRSWSRIVHRPSLSKSVRTARTGPQVEASTTSRSSRFSPLSVGVPSNTRCSLGNIAVRISLRPRSDTVRCRTLPSWRKDSTTRTYSLTEPLEDGILTVRMNMKLALQLQWIKSIEKTGRNDYKSENVVTTVFGPRARRHGKNHGNS